MNNVELKPCPFCKHNGMSLSYRDGICYREWYVVCSYCGTLFCNINVEYDKDKTIKWWNGLKD